MSRIRILRIQSRICIGGPALNSILLSANVDPRKYETLLVGGRLERGERSMEPFAASRGVSIRMIQEMGRSLRWFDDLKALYALVRLIRSYRPHIVHTHTAKAGAIGRVAAWLCRVPIRIHTFHGHVFSGYFSPTVTRIYIWIERAFALISTRIIAISPAQKRDLTTRYRVVREGKCEIVRLGFELDAITRGEPGAFRSSFGYSPRIRLIAILARLVPIKNHELLLRGIASWRRLVPEASPQEWRFLIIGDGETRERLESLTSELGIGEFVDFLGWQDDPARIYADIDLNVLVSLNEGTPVTLIEGLACGVPILTTDVGGIRDFADDDCGWILPADTGPEALGEKLAEILSGPEGIAPLAEETSRRIRSAFHVDRLVGDMEGIYRRLLAEKNLSCDSG